MTPRSTLHILIIGQRSRSPGQKRNFRVHLIVLQVILVKFKGWSNSKVPWVKVEGHMGQGGHVAQFKTHDICRWAHINVKLHFLYIQDYLERPDVLTALDSVCSQQNAQAAVLMSLSVNNQNSSPLRQLAVYSPNILIKNEVSNIHFTSTGVLLITCL